MQVTLLLAAVCLSSPLPKDGSHRSTFTHSIAAGAGAGLGAGITTNLVNRWFEGRDRRRAEREAAKANVNNNNVSGCNPGSIVMINTPAGPRKGVIAQDCSIFTG